MATHSPTQSNLTERKAVLNEILESEQNYTTFLECLREVYENPLRELAKSVEPPPLISQQDVDMIFAHLDPIRSVHKRLLADLEEHVNQTKQLGTKITKTLGAIFLKYASEFLCYTAYCNNFGNVAARIRELKKTKEVDTWLSKQKRSARSQNNSLESFLIMPVQKLPRYNLLLQEMLKKTNKLHRDFEDLTKALEVMKVTNDHVNTMIREYNNSQKMQNIAQVIKNTGMTDFELVAENRKFIFDEEKNVGVYSLKLDMRRNNLMMHVYNDVIVLMRYDLIVQDLSVDMPEKKKGFRFKGLIQVEEEKVEPAPTIVQEPQYELVYENHILLGIDPLPWIKDSTNNSFQIVTGGDLFTFYAPNEAKKSFWIKTIVDCLEKITKQNLQLKKRRARIQTKEQLTPPLPVIQLAPPTKTPNRRHTTIGKRKSIFGFLSQRASDDPDIIAALPKEVSYHTHPLISHVLLPKRDTTEMIDFAPNPLRPRTQEELSRYKAKGVMECDAVVRAMSTLTDSEKSIPADELTFHKGDILIVFEKLSKDYWLAKKLGLNCNPNRKKELVDGQMPTEYDALKRIMRQQRSEKKIIPGKETEPEKVLRRINSHFIQLDDNAIFSSKEKEFSFDFIPEDDIQEEEDWSGSQSVPTPVVTVVSPIETVTEEKTVKRRSLSDVLTNLKRRSLSIMNSEGAEVSEAVSPVAKESQAPPTRLSLGFYEGDDQKQFFDQLINVIQ
jgi:hypothetical protein